MAFTLPALPYAKNALAPHISEETVSFHYEKHHAGYVTKLNQMTEGTPVAQKSLEEVVKTEKGKVFNMAAQVRQKLELEELEETLPRGCKVSQLLRSPYSSLLG